MLTTLFKKGNARNEFVTKHKEIPQDKLCPDFIINVNNMNNGSNYVFIDNFNEKMDENI